MSTAALSSQSIVPEKVSFSLTPTLFLLGDGLFALFCFFVAPSDSSGIYWLALLGAIQLFPVILAMAKQRLDYLAVSSFATFATFTLGKYNNAFYVRRLST